MKPSRSPLAQQFTRAEEPMKNRIIALSAGEPGSRKTSFWLEAPAPIVIHSLDRGLEGVVQRYQETKDIYFQEYDWTTRKENPVETAKDVWDEFWEKFKISVEHARTVLLDKEVDFWALCRYANNLTGGDDQKDYAEANSQMRDIVSLAKASDINLGLITGLKDQWGSVMKSSGAMGKGPTGKRIPAGQKEMSGLVHMVLMHTGLSPATWAIEVGKVRGPGAVEIAEQSYSFEVVPDFATFAQLVFPDTTEDDWR